MANSVQKYDPDSGLPFCLFHPDRVEHFYCDTHKVFFNLFRALGVEYAFKSVITMQIAV